MKKVKVAIVGCSYIGTRHADRLMRFPDVELVGFYNRTPEKARALAAMVGTGKVYENYVEMLDESRPDAVFVCVSPLAHGPFEIEAAARGIHLFIEKPMAVDMKTAEEMGDAIRRAGIITSVGFQDRYLDLMEPLRDCLEDNPCGLVTGTWVDKLPNAAWWWTRAASGGQVVEQNIHLFDTLRWLVGEPASVYAVAGSGLVRPAFETPGYDIDDYSVTAVTFQNGVTASLVTGDYINNAKTVKNGLTFIGRDLTLDYHLREKLVITSARERREIWPQSDQTVTVCRVFIDAVKTGNAEKILSPYDDALKSLAFVVATNTSLETGLPASLR